MGQNADISGMEHAYSSGILTNNANLEKIVETSDEWITSRTGIKQRHKAAPDEYSSQFAVLASPDSEGANLKSEDIEIISAQVLTKYVDYTDRGTYVIFGDGASAVVLGTVAEEKGILATKIRLDGRHEEQLYAPSGGRKLGTSCKTIDDGMHFSKMKGNDLFKIVVRSMADISAEILLKADYTVDGVDLVISHQANQRLTDAVALRLGVPEEKVYSNIAEQSNTSSASMPIGIDE